MRTYIIICDYSSFCNSFCPFFHRQNPTSPARMRSGYSGRRFAIFTLKLQNIKNISETSTKITGRAILQLTDDMTLIKRYDTIAQAVRETGVNSKSIRDAAKGVQKHAGGYVWKYADEIGD